MKNLSDARSQTPLPRWRSQQNMRNLRTLLSATPQQTDNTDSHKRKAGRFGHLNHKCPINPTGQRRFKYDPLSVVADVESVLNAGDAQHGDAANLGHTFLHQKLIIQEDSGIDRGVGIVPVAEPQHVPVVVDVDRRGPKAGESEDPSD